jgi:hypothetical protein
MKTFKLQENESLIDSFDLSICVLEPKLKELFEKKQFINYFWESPFSTTWHQTKLYFTSYRIELQTGGEQISIAYKDVKNIGITNMRNRPKKTGALIGLAGFLGLGGGIILINSSDNKGLSILGGIVLGINVIYMLFLLIFRWVKTYNIYLGEQADFSIMEDEEIIERIKDAYEKGKHFTS